jgi:hypothetical protein
MFYELARSPSRSAARRRTPGRFPVCRIIEREGERLLVEKWRRRYWIRVKTWQEWLEKSGTDVTVSGSSRRVKKSGSVQKGCEQDSH